MKYLPLKIWFIVTVTLAFGAVIIRLIWELTFNPSAGTLIVIILLILAILAFHTLLIYLTIKPDLKKLKSLPVGVLVAVMATAGLISSVTHFIRFVPSPEANEPLSLIIASLLLLAVISAYSLILWVIWSLWQARKS